MHESPSTAQLLDAVIGFLNNVAAPALVGQAQFHARVSANALALVAREMLQGQAADASAIALYSALLGSEDVVEPSLAVLESALCDAIRAGEMDHNTPNLLATLRQVTVAQLAIDQPNYSGLTP